MSVRRLFIGDRHIRMMSRRLGHTIHQAQKPSGNPGFSAEACVAVQGDSVAHPVRWQASALAELASGEYALKFRMRHASLYA